MGWAVNSAGRAEGGRREIFWQSARWRAAQGWVAVRAIGLVCTPGVPIGFGRARAEEAEEEAARACGGPFKHMDMALAAVRSAQSLRDCWRLAVVSFWSQPAKGYTRT